LDPATPPTSITRLKLTGTGVETDYLYVRGRVADTGENIAVYATPTVAGAQSPAFAFDIPPSLSTSDRIVASDLSRVYVGTTSGLSVIAAGPWLSYDASALEVPVQVSDSASTFTVTLTSDVATDAVYFAEDEPYEATEGQGDSDTMLSPDTATTVEIDVSSLSLTMGVHRLFLYAEDAETGTLGWTSIRVKVPPPAPDFSLDFGDERLYLHFGVPDDGVTGYEVVISTETFATGDDFDLTSRFKVTVDATGEVFTYPSSKDPDGEWPLNLAYDADDPYWSRELDGSLTYELCPLDNDKTYYVAVRAISGSSSGNWSDVLSGTPEETCGSFCLADDAGGSCACSQPGRPVPAKSGWRFYALGLFIPAGWLRWCRRQVRA
jgi:hypothetical protein